MCYISAAFCFYTVQNVGVIGYVARYIPFSANILPTSKI